MAACPLVPRIFLNRFEFLPAFLAGFRAVPRGRRRIVAIACPLAEVVNNSCQVRKRCSFKGYLRVREGGYR